ncbi:SGNH/GDSL hydrolase family protein [Streptomyces sp. NPDC058674]|uniref:SGNH/GDSL hydrolase family protein n=1 Tax=Streptomyces sp. NPDC058674 TaxID=3346592 RepID=UPI0036639EC6
MYILRSLLAALALTAATCLPTTIAAPAAAATPPVIRVMPLGDSITAGLGSTTGAGYRLPLWQRAAAQTRYRIDYVGGQNAGAVPDADHEGHRGWHISQIRAEIDGLLTTAQPTYVLLHIGINDLAWGANPQTAADALTDLIDRIQARQPGVTILLLGLIPTTQGLQQPVAAYNQRAAGIARPRLHYLGAPALTIGEMADSLHPNDVGYARLADTLYTELTRREIARQRATGTQPTAPTGWTPTAPAPRR